MKIFAMGPSPTDQAHCAGPARRCDVAQYSAGHNRSSQPRNVDQTKPGLHDTDLHRQIGVQVPGRELGGSTVEPRPDAAGRGSKVAAAKLPVPITGRQKRKMALQLPPLSPQSKTTDPPYGQ
jgi:hypothetical protein